MGANLLPKENLFFITYVFSLGQNNGREFINSLIFLPVENHFARALMNAIVWYAHDSLQWPLSYFFIPELFGQATGIR